jgi:hypothetical protein
VANLVNPPNDELVLSNETLSHENQIFCAETTPNSWYSNIKFYLMHGTTLEHIDPKSRMELRLRYTPFKMNNDVIFRNNFDGVLLCCLANDESKKFLTELHSGNAEGHFGGKTKLLIKCSNLDITEPHFLEMLIIWITSVK